MAIFGAIPMPQNSGDVFSGHVNNMIKQLMDRQHQEQQQGQYNRTLAQQQQQHKDAMGFQQQTQNRLNQMLPLQIQALNDAHEKMQFETNPAKRMEYMKQIVQGIKSMRENPAGGAQTQDQQMPMEQPNFPMFQGGGMPNMQQPQAQQQQQVAPPSMEQLQQGFGGLTPEEIQTAEMAGIKFPKPYETPQMKSERDIRDAATKEQQTLDIKRKDALRDELPEAEELIEKIKEARKIVKNHSDLFGPGVGGIGAFGGPSQRKRGLKTKAERQAWATMEDLFGTLVGKKAQEYSHKGLKVAFDLASTTKPSFDDYAEMVDTKLASMQKGLETGHARDSDWYRKAGGKPSNNTKELTYNPVTGRLE